MRIFKIFQEIEFYLKNHFEENSHSYIQKIYNFSKIQIPQGTSYGKDVRKFQTNFMKSELVPGSFDLKGIYTRKEDCQFRKILLNSTNFAQINNLTTLIHDLTFFVKHKLIDYSWYVEKPGNSKLFTGKIIDYLLKYEGAGKHLEYHALNKGIRDNFFSKKYEINF